MMVAQALVLVYINVGENSIDRVLYSSRNMSSDMRLLTGNYRPKSLRQSMYDVNVDMKFG